MWFGDLVTMGWWEGIWLNEAFATFMEMLCVDAFRPSWDRWAGFAPSREAALAVDGVHSTRPIEYPVGPPKEAEGMFDLLTYEKGCGVLRMLEQHIGPDVFRDGVRTYLKAHAYGNTMTTDLWDALEDASGAPVRDIMNTFILQGGHPLVTLDNGELHQQPFAYGPVPAGHRVGHRHRLERPGRRAGPARTAITAGAPLRRLVLAPSPSRSPRSGKGRLSSTPVAGACSGWATRRNIDWPSPSTSPSSRRSSGPTCSATPGPPRWPGTRSSKSSSASGVDGSAWSPTPAHGPPSAPRSSCATGSPVPMTAPALHQGVAALVGPAPPAPRLRGDAGRG